MSNIQVAIDLLHQLEKVKAQRDELLEALEKVIDEWQYGSSIEEANEVYTKAKEAIAKAKGSDVMRNVEQYYKERLAEIRRGGNTSHTVFVTDCIGGHHSPNLGPVDPPVVGIVGEDEYYVEYFQNWDEVNKFIGELKVKATKEWGSICH